MARSTWFFVKAGSFRFRLSVSWPTSCAAVAKLKQVLSLVGTRERRDSRIAGAGEGSGWRGETSTQAPRVSISNGENCLSLTLSRPRLHTTQLSRSASAQALLLLVHTTPVSGSCRLFYPNLQFLSLSHLSLSVALFSSDQNALVKLVHNFPDYRRRREIISGSKQTTADERGRPGGATRNKTRKTKSSVTKTIEFILWK